jgi:hypothetical protein
MRPDLSLSIRLRSFHCDGLLAEGIFDIKPSEPNYEVVMDHVGCNPTNKARPCMAYAPLSVGLEQFAASLRPANPTDDASDGPVRHGTPVRLSRGDCSCQFGLASAPTIPQLPGAAAELVGGDISSIF